MESDRPQGRILTENPAALAALLREDTGDYIPPDAAMARQAPSTHQDSTVRRVYVDTPLSVNDDEDKYQFVSTNADDLVTSQDYEETETLTYAGHTVPDPPSGRYEDRSDALSNRNYPPEVIPEQTAQPQVQYVVRSKPNSSNLGSQQQQFRGDVNNERFGQHPNSGAGEPHIVQPIKSPLSPPSKADQEEMRALQEEAEYQQHLRTKLWQQTKQAEQIQIPRLALEQLEEEDKPRRAPMPLHDSLEDEYIVGDSLEERQARSAFNNAHKQFGQHSHGNPTYSEQYPSYQNQGMVQDSLEIQDSYGDPNYNSTGQEYIQDYGQPMTGTGGYGQVEPSNDPVPYYLGGDHVNSTQAFDNPVHQPESVMSNQQTFSNPTNYGIAMDAQGHPHHVHQGHALPHDVYDSNTQNYIPQQQDYRSNQERDSTKHYSNDPDSFSDHEHHLVDVDMNQNMFSRPVAKLPPKPEKDFVNRNKQVLAQGPARKTYGQIHSTKNKDIKENQSPSRTSHHSSKVASNQRPSAESPAASPNSAEQLWAKRAQRLENQKNVKLSAKSKSGSLRKYSSESRVDRARDSAATIKSSPGSYQARAPHHVQPLAQRLPAPQKSLAEPIKSDVTARSGSPNQPISHTIITEDGQRLSVDINLKVISPTPNKGGVVPQPAAPGQQYTTWQQNPAAFRPHIPYHQDTGHQMAPPYGQQGPAPPTQSDYSTDTYPVQGFSSPRDNLTPQVTTPQTPLSGPFRVLPPIGSADTDKSRSTGTVIPGQTSPKAGGTGYADQYKSQRNHRPEYKEYTLEDYRKLRKEIRLGGLGPDKDNETAREKREKRQRQLEYAKTLKTRPMPATVPNPPDRLTIEDEEDTLNRRKVALEYAKSVPKPKVRSSPKLPSPNSKNTREEDLPRSNYEPQSYHEGIPQSSQPRANQNPDLEVFDLKKLQERHERERNQVALIRQNMENISQA